MKLLGPEAEESCKSTYYKMKLNNLNSPCLAAIFASDKTRNGSRDSGTRVRFACTGETSASLHIKRLAKLVAQNMLPYREPKLITMEKAISDEFPYSYSRTSMTILNYLTLLWNENFLKKITACSVTKVSVRILVQ